MEIEKVLRHSNKLYDYISANLSMYEAVNECSDGITEMRRKKDLLKRCYINNSAKSIQLGLKKRNIEKSITFMKHLKALKEISDVLKLLSNNSSKLLISYGLIEKGRSIVNLYRDKNIKLLRTFEEELILYTNKIMDKLIAGFGRDFREGVRSLITFNQTSSQDLTSHVRLISKHRESGLWLQSRRF
jgi:hypothetical protein